MVQQPEEAASGSAATAGPSTLPSSSTSTPPSTAKLYHPAATSSSAAFLHHLHNAPSSHHITLPATSGRHSTGHGLTLQNMPAPISQPLEPVVKETNKPAVSPAGGPPSLAAASGPSSRTSSTATVTTVSSSSTLGLSAEEEGSGGQAVAGPSSLSGIRRGSSKRMIRPKTAPHRFHDDNSLPSQDRSPEPLSTGRMGDAPVFDDSPSLEAPSGGTFPVGEEEDDCITLASQEVDLAQSADDMMAIMSGEGSSKAVLLGRAGSLAPSSASDPTPEMSEPPQPQPVSWKTFATAYSRGRFDPNKTPTPPSASQSPADAPSAHSSPGRSARSLAASVPQHPTQPAANARGAHTSSSTGSLESSKTSLSSGSQITSATTLSSSSSLPVREIGHGMQQSTSDTKSSMAAALAARTKAFELENLPNRPAASLMPDKLALPTYSFAAATVRMASSNLRDSDFLPLAVPSPERELLDPMASVVSHASSASVHNNGASSDPGSIRYPLSRSMSTAAPTTPGHHEMLLPTIQASPVGTPEEQQKNRAGLPANYRIPSATAPLAKAHDVEASDDYFGNAPSPFDTVVSSSQAPTGGEPTPVAPQPAIRRALTPTTDRPPPVAQPHEIGDVYEKFGWLPAPLPPNESERRKALYRYNILHTAADVNFDRIAHMAKLVFNTKIVLLALIDSDSQWHKSQTGLGANEASRISSFCSHSVLATSDEPFVVLDASQDWRFANNPQVIGAPHIRFYAGAPLRTSDGYNLGSLCIIDDKPRTEFPPRSRLILKEFAAVAMRELELWRDKLQLRVRDRIQVSMEKFTRECLEIDEKSTTSHAEVAARMDQVYARAAKLVCQTLDLSGCVILDIGQFEAMQVEAEGGQQTVYKANPYSDQPQSPVFERNDGFGPVSAFPVLATTPTSVPTRSLTAEEHVKVSEFLGEYKDGKIFENVAPSWIRYMFPSSLKYGMVVPVFGVDQQPFAMICAYTLDKGKQFLEGYELQFLRAIGVIILSAVLRRRMVLADKAKSILISSVSHELRTPLHGILAAAELLQDTRLDSNQDSLLKTVQTCGKSLIETVNHVLDFTKLSGAGKGVTKDTIQLGVVDLATLVEQTVEGCWIGQRARTMHGDSDVGSFYAPDAKKLLARSERATVGAALAHVETVIDISQRMKGWKVHCEKGGLRRVLMNLVGNSLKFTKDGYVQVSLRELPHSPGSKTIPVEMAVIDTGKGIGKEFLKDQLFHPFSQENPLQTGTGLGLAIVNSIVRSDSVNGKVDVWSSEGMGTEIRVSFDVEVVDEDASRSHSSHGSQSDDLSKSISSMSSVFLTEPNFGRNYSVCFLGFNPEHRGLVLNREVLSTYVSWWSFEVVAEPANASILVVNETSGLPEDLRDLSKPIIFLNSTKASMSAQRIDPIKKAGGWATAVHKPIGPSSLRRTLREAVQWMQTGETGEIMDEQVPDADGAEATTANGERPPISRGSSGESGESQATVSDLPTFAQSSPTNSRVIKDRDSRMPLQRRRSEEDSQSQKQQLSRSATRPSMAPRGMTYHSTPQQKIADEVASQSSGTSSPGSPSAISTISLADGGVMLKAAAVPSEAPRRARKPRVMVVEDNMINRRVLGAYLSRKGAEFAEAHDGQAGVELFEDTPANHWDIILMDISMPVMNGYDATKAIRAVEAARRNAPASELPKIPSPGKPVVIPPTPVVQIRTKIFALTGLATPDDKRQAFGSGVDGYLVKPVSLASLDTIFKKIGF